MGNVFASSMPSQPSSPLSGQMNPEKMPEFIPAQSPFSNNPGSIDELHRKCKEVFPLPFDGCKVVVNKMLSNHFNITHNIIMTSGMLQPSCYRFGATYIGTRQISPTEAFPIFYGEIDPNGNLNSRIIHLAGDRLRLNLGAHFQNSRCLSTQLTSDYLAPDYTASLTLSNIDPVRDSGIAVASYLQNITNKLSLGAELLLQHNSKLTYSVLSLAGRYTSPDNYIISGAINDSSVQLYYYQKKNQYLQVGVQIETNLREPDSTAAFGYQIDLPKSNFVFKGIVDSNWNVGGMFEKKLMTPLPFTFLCSALINHTKAQTKVGVGLCVG